MRRRFIVIGIITAVAVSVAYIIGFRTIAAREDVLDRDFVAMIHPTKTRLTFVVEVRKVSEYTRKQISVRPIYVDLTVEDSSGHVLTEGIGLRRYIGSVSGNAVGSRKRPSESVTVMVGLATDELKPGLYEVEPRVRIIETGEDRLRGPYGDGGSVAVPSGNSVKVEIR